MTQPLVQLITATMGAMAFSLIFNVRGKQLFFTTFGGFLAWSICLVLAPTGLGLPVRYLIASICATIYAEVCARRRRTPATVFLVSAVIPLVPGSSLYTAMVYAVHQNGEAFVAHGLRTLLLAGAIAGGIILISTIMHAYHAYVQLRQPHP